MDLAEEFDLRFQGGYFSYEEMRCKCDDCQEHDDGKWFRTAEWTSFMAGLISMRGDLGFSITR